MKEFKTGAIRDSGGKGRMDLLPMCALIRVSQHMEDAILPDPQTGQPHYPERNWEKGMPIHCMIDSALRHLAKYVDGLMDEDHLCAAATNLLMAMWTEEKHPEMNDMPWTVTTESPNAMTPKEFEDALKKCEHFHKENGENVCWATKNQSICDCNGDKNNCTFYPSDEYPSDYE